MKLVGTSLLLLLKNLLDSFNWNLCLLHPERNPKKYFYYIDHALLTLQHLFQVRTHNLIYLCFHLYPVECSKNTQLHNVYSYVIQDILENEFAVSGGGHEGPSLFCLDKCQFLLVE